MPLRAAPRSMKMASPLGQGGTSGGLIVGTTTPVLRAAVAVICRQRTRHTNHPRRGCWPRRPLLD